jgi:hypothetical protein
MVAGVGHSRSETVFHSCGWAGNLIGLTISFAGCGADVEKLSVEFDAEVVTGRVLAQAEVVTQIHESFCESLGILAGATEIGADSVLLLGMGGAESGEPHQFSVHLRLFDDERVARGDGLDFGLGQGGRIEVLKPTDGHVAAHDLGDEFGLGLQGRLSTLGRDLQHVVLI